MAEHTGMNGAEHGASGSGTPRKGSLTMGRSCGDCRVCCKLPDIPELSKPRDTWCQHASKAKGPGGCTQYESRPGVCREFSCGWLSGLGEAQDRPDRLGVLWQPLELPDGRPGMGVVEARPGALNEPRAQAWLEHFNRSKPGQVVVRKHEHPVFQMVGLTVERRTPEIGLRSPLVAAQVEARPGFEGTGTRAGWGPAVAGGVRGVRATVPA